MTSKNPLEILGDQRKGVQLMSNPETFGPPLRDAEDDAEHLAAIFEKYMSPEPDSRPADGAALVERANKYCGPVEEDETGDITIVRDLASALAAEKAAREKAEADCAYAMTEARRNVSTLAALTSARADLRRMTEALTAARAEIQSWVDSHLSIDNAVVPLETDVVLRQIDAALGGSNVADR